MSYFGDLGKGALDSAVSGLVNGAVGAIFRPSLKRQMKYQKEGLRFQQQLAHENYDYQYDKTKPSTMVELYRDAGLNPGLMYSGNAGSGLHASMGSSSAPNLQPYTGSPTTNPSMVAQIENLNSSSNLNDSQSNLVDEKVKSEKLEQINKELESLQRRLDLAKTEDERKKLQAEKGVLEAQKELINSQRVTEDELRDSKKAEIDASAELSAQRSLSEKILRDYKARDYDVGIALKDAQTTSQVFHNWYEQTHHTKMSSGMSALIDRCVEMVFGTKQFQSFIQNPGGEENEVSFVNAIWNALKGSVGNTTTFDMVFPLLSLLYRILTNNKQ